jgi:hypothetical protein
MARTTFSGDARSPTLKPTTSGIGVGKEGGEVPLANGRLRVVGELGLVDGVPRTI